MQAIIGYAIVGGGEAGRYLENTLKEFQRLCDDAVLVLNNATVAERRMVENYGFKIKEDNREWGKNQHRIKNDLMVDLANLNPTYLVCLDADEVFDPQMTKEKLIEMLNKTDALYFYILNLWNEGWKRSLSFWNVRAWKWNGQTKFSNRPLHCGLAPEWCYHYASHAPFYVKHYGLMKQEDRQKKIERYQKYDPKAIYRDVSYYNALADNTCDTLDENWLRGKIVDEAGQLTKKQMTEKKERYCYVRNPHGVVIDIPASQLQETLSRKGFVYVGDVVADRSEEVAVIEPPKLKE
jgi:hypothetical protein